MSGETVILDRHLYLTEDRARVVEEGDPEGRWLWASPGQEVSHAEAERLGAITPEPEPVKVEAEVEAKPKRQAPRPNKQRAKPADKAE